MRLMIVLVSQTQRLGRLGNDMLFMTAEQGDEDALSAKTYCAKLSEC